MPVLCLDVEGAPGRRSERRPFYTDWLRLTSPRPVRNPHQPGLADFKGLRQVNRLGRCLPCRSGLLGFDRIELFLQKFSNFFLDKIFRANKILNVRYRRRASLSSSTLFLNLKKGSAEEAKSGDHVRGRGVFSKKESPHSRGDEVITDLPIPWQPLAARAAKEAMVRGSSLPLEEGLRLERSLFGYLTGTEDYLEGTTAFLEKRKPIFKGK